MKKLLVCDDHSIVRRGLKDIFAIHFSNFQIDECCSVAQSLNYLKSTTPDFAIFDLQLSDGNMLEAIPHIISTSPQLNILIYSMCNEDAYGKRVLQMGARGFLSKTTDDDELVRALSIFLSEKNYISNRLSNTLISSFQNKKNEKGENPFSWLSNREMEVVQLLLAGKNIKGISNKMNLHANTIVTYKNRVFEKLAITNIIELTNIARLYNFD